ncbi:MULTISPECIES: hypothetical protein [Rhizobium]|jgi:hypothetical protein|uniref:hypothetical protein n=1 Tax=Rhizobium TaxID=379 RepID=UPI0010317087|nr:MULTISPECIES: hypothetical protein [Rhizobium]NEJ06248.1 hypothetical protein [Rhizobium ruizarguesonis]QIO58757.1 hypothetical protein HA463_14140 [Rhizobium leguminosarum bv. trifolii]TBA14681.1 hypothetical protein ELH65_01120 [Rhizobium ruizarguesonis]
MNRTPGISRASSSRPEDVFAKAIAGQSEHQQRLDLLRRRRQERLLAIVRSSRADFTRETESRRRLLSSIVPPPVADPLIVEIEKQWARLFEDYRRYRKATPYPGERGGWR